MDLWFAASQGDGYKFDRLTTLKAAMFDIFANHNRNPPVLDYIGMVSVGIAIVHSKLLLETL